MQSARRTLRCAAILTAGSSLATSCTPQQLNAVLNGVTALASVLNQEQEEPSFFDWLEGELDD